MDREMTTEDEPAVLAVITRLIDSWNRHDTHSLAALFAEDADFVDVFGNWFRDREAIERALAERHKTVFKESSFREKEIVVRFQKRDVAVVHAVVELSGAFDRQGQPLPPGFGVMTFVVTKAESDWRITAFQNTAVAAAAGTTR